MVTINNNEVYSSNGLYIRRKSTNNYFKRATICQGETAANFEEVAEKPSEELLQAIEEKKAEINAYDKSNNVNGFTYQGDFMWLDKEERFALQDRFSREINKGLEKTNLYYKGKRYDLKPEEGLALVNEIAGYADACFDRTQEHLAAVENLTTIEEVKNYDYTTGYPQKLSI